MKWCTCLFVVLLSAFAQGDARLILATRNAPAEYVLVCPADASPSQQYAAEEFRDFTKKLTGVTLSITNDHAPLPKKAILLGNTRYTSTLLKKDKNSESLGEDGFHVKAIPPHLLIIGSPVRGTLYGAYEILEKFGGCRWYTSWHSVIPSLQTFEVPADLDDTQRPAFAMREPFWFDHFQGDFAARCRSNGNAMRLGEKHGGHSFRFGGGLGSCHTFNVLVPPEKYFDQHPEYFSEIDGKRKKEYTQLCLTNPDVLKIVTQRVLEAIRRDPGAKFYGVSQNDWYNFCTCSKCREIDEREESHAGTMVAFVNAVAEAVEKEFPNVIIETLAYQYTRKPPKYLRLRKNVVPCLCTIECDFSFGLAQSRFEENVAFCKDIKGWSAMTDQLYVWDYTTNFRHYPMPFPNVLALQDNIRFFRENHVKELFEQGAYQGRHGDFAELKGWLLAKWMWNPDLPLEPLLDDFFTGYYGAAAPYVRTYFDALHRYYRNEAKQPLRIFDDVRTICIPDSFFDRARLLWDLAEKAVQNDPARLYHVQMGAFSVRYLQMMRRKPVSMPKIWVAQYPEAYFPPKELREEAAWLLERMNDAKNIRLCEPPETNQQRIEGWKELVHPNIPSKGTTRALVPARLLRLVKPGEWGAMVDDPKAADGRAMKLFNTHYEWCTSLSLSDVAFDSGATYQIRARIRVEKKADAKGEAFWSGVYDSERRQSCGGVERTCQSIPNGEYVWYDIVQWVPRTGQYFWIGPGRFDKKKGTSAIQALYIDEIEMKKIP